MTSSPNRIYTKQRNGDPLTNKEVLEGLIFFKDLADRLMKCGPIFHLAFTEANHTYFTLRGYAEARNLSIPDDY